MLQYTYHGNLGAFTSGIVTGDTVKVRFTSDVNGQRIGFHIDTLEHSVISVSGSAFMDVR